MYQHRQGSGWLEYGFAETHLCFVANNKIDMRQKGILVAKSVSSLLGCIRESSINRQGEGDPLSTGDTYLDYQAQL